jgi:hypothetical protein
VRKTRLQLNFVAGKQRLPQRSFVKEEADQKMKLEERAQHTKLLEMLHNGKISKEMYKVMKPSGF